MQSNGFGATVIGTTRQINEDALWVNDSLGVYAVADGMGGAHAGELAARMVTERVGTVLATQEGLLRDVGCGLETLEVLEETLRSAIQAASEEVYEIACGAVGRHGMGASLAVLVVVGSRALVAHVGDCRVYVRRWAAWEQLTEDHTWAASLARHGVITQHEIIGHRYQRVLLRRLGGEYAPIVDMKRIDLNGGEVFLLCTNGASPRDPDAALAMATTNASADSALAFVRRSDDRDSEDDATVVVVRVGEGTTAPTRTPFAGRLWRAVWPRARVA